MNIADCTRLREDIQVCLQRELFHPVFSLALVVEGIPILGVIYDPFTDNLYNAIKGEGAYQNENKITVNNIELDNKKSVSHFDMWPASQYNIYDAIKELNKKNLLC